MGNNLPPGAATDPRAPWNRDERDPEIICKACNWAGDRDDLDFGADCPACGSQKIGEI
jgi:Zn finger protein HypA/HybF involved in hydrogenase expression